VLDKLMGLRKDPDITLQKLDDIINEDPALCVAMLKAANTPILGRGRHITSVHQAISLLGIKNVISLVSGLVLRTRLTAETPPALEQFWDGTLQIAMISSALCDRIVHVTDDCRSFALFHNCGMAIMLMRFPVTAARCAWWKWPVMTVSGWWSRNCTAPAMMWWVIWWPVAGTCRKTLPKPS
jgi:HD-like signal output (HDOD) protein